MEHSYASDDQLVIGSFDCSHLFSTSKLKANWFMCYQSDCAEAIRIRRIWTLQRFPYYPLQLTWAAVARLRRRRLRRSQPRRSGSGAPFPPPPPPTASRRIGRRVAAAPLPESAVAVVVAAAMTLSTTATALPGCIWTRRPVPGPKDASAQCQRHAMYWTLNALEIQNPCAAAFQSQFRLGVCCRTDRQISNPSVSTWYISVIYQV
jgi:hypothetical protein